jgi:hypothetical protein
VAAVATVSTAVTDAHRAAGASAADALAAGLSRAALLLAITSAAGVALALLMGRHRDVRPQAVHRVAAAAAIAHTIPIGPPGFARTGTPSGGERDPAEQTGA